MASSRNRAPAFSASIWASTAGLRRAIHDLPFNRDLADGTLSENRFRFYMVQDSIYLEKFSRALAVAAARAPEPEAMQRFAGASEGALVVERALHEGFFRKFGIAPEDAARTDPSPTCEAYTRFLLAVAYGGSFGELVAALLPCFWIYWDVGNRIARDATRNNPYQAWIDTYCDPDFGQSVDAVIAIADRAAEAASPSDRDAMAAAFIRSAQYEWMFWDSAYRMETWPVTPEGRAGENARHGTG